MFFDTAMQSLWSSEVGAVAIFFGLLPLIIQSFNNHYYLAHKLSEEILKHKIKIISVIFILFILNAIILILGQNNANQVLIYTILGFAYIYLFYTIYKVLKILEDPSDIKNDILNYEKRYLYDLIDEYAKVDNKREVLFKIKQRYYLYAQYCNYDYNEIHDVIDFLTDVYFAKQTELNNNTFMITGYVVSLLKYNNLDNFGILSLLCYINYVLNEKDKHINYKNINKDSKINQIMIPLRLFYILIEEIEKCVILPKEYEQLLIILLYSAYKMGGKEHKTYNLMIEKVKELKK